MDIQGKVIQFIGETSGVSKAGNPWKKKEWVIETFGQFPRKVKIQCFGDRADQINLEPGRDYTLYVDVESREYMGRWYTDVSVYRADEYVSTPSSGGQPQGEYQSTPQGGFGNLPYGNNGSGFDSGSNFSSNMNEESDEDLPF